MQNVIQPCNAINAMLSEATIQKAKEVKIRQNIAVGMWPKTSKFDFEVKLWLK